MFVLSDVISHEVIHKDYRWNISAVIKLALCSGKQREVAAIPNTLGCLVRHFLAK